MAKTREKPFAARPAPAPHSWTWICTCCQREETTQDKRIPLGWDVSEGNDTAATVVHCPDCNEQIEADYIATLSSIRAETIGFDLGRDRYEKTIVCMGDPRPFSVCLVRQNDGSYRVALSPEQVTMLFSPGAFLLTTAEAYGLAAELMRMGERAANPGTIGTAA